MQFKEIIQYTENLNLLYIEEDLNIIKDTIEILNIFFKKIDIEMDGEGALESYKRDFYQRGKYYDIIITESNLPIINGDILISEIKKINPKQIIIVLSSKAEEDKMISFIKNGVQDFIKKPIVMMELQDALYSISKVVSKRKTKQEEKLKTNKIGNTDSEENTKWYDNYNILC